MTDEILGRLHAMGIDPGRAFDDVPGDLSPDVGEMLRGFLTTSRRELLDQLAAAEAEIGPPTGEERMRRLDLQARYDPRMPPWVRRHWRIPAEAMLVVDEIVRERFGRGSSLTGPGLPSIHETGPIRLVVHPAPAVLPDDPDERDEAGRGAEREIERRTGVETSLRVWRDAAPERALAGLLCGRVHRDGCVELGTVRDVYAGIELV